MIKLHHAYPDGTHVIGRFRLSATRVARPIGLGLPEDFRSILATVPEIRSETHGNTLLAFHRAIDPEYRRRIDALAASRGPLPADPRRMELQARVEAAARPFPLDPRLAQLRSDVEMSISRPSIADSPRLRT